ncbi:MAG: CinA family nicotinamide mononucleotide deamidase-related protein [Kiritimatiellae bacterium]|nr:CinA family nicotinamide mononucleotide deamidase-related protein [Kiritimatiellia bacterium]MDW8458840.1 CinA family nicotinamide mononucleotide deamidase-related protein [Verrucomicrobiota bacterium]
MRAEVFAELICTGSELLSGRTVNTHVATLATALEPLGIPLVRETTVPDDRAAIRDAIEQALARSPIVITSGGLGPTSDDLTRDVAAEIAGTAVVMHEPTREKLRKRFEAAGRVFTDIAARHALIVQGATVLENEVGFCPGELIEIRGRRLYLTPGPPAEFRAVVENGILPTLRALAGTPPVRRIFMTCCIGESEILRLLPESEFPGPGIDIAYCARPGRVEIRLSAPPNREEALDRAAARARETLAPWIYAERPCNLEEALVDLLRSLGRTVAIAESCTGGLIGHLFTEVPGSSHVFLGGVVAYSNESKTRDLGVPPQVLDAHGAVSAETARAMALGVRARFGSNYGLAVTGIAGPSGGSPQKPVGLVYMCATDGSRFEERQRKFSGVRSVIKQLSAQWAMDALRRLVLQGA